MILEKIKEIIVDTVGCDAEEINPSANLYKDLEIDSLDAVELTMALEEAYNIHISDEKLSSLETVQDIIDCVEAELN